MAAEGRLIVVSNRIPTEATPSGGLVVALHQALSARGGVWIGSSGERTEVPGPLRHIASGAYDRRAFDLTEAEHEGFYLGYANSVLWPLFHRRADLINVHEAERQVYLDVNDRVAGLIAEAVAPGDMLWIHDYHFLPLGQALRQRGVSNRLGFFLHIPFPAPSDAPALPDRRVLPEWLAAYDLVGLQANRDVRNCLDLFSKEPSAEVASNGRVRFGDRRLEVGAFPIGIDVDAIREAAEATETGTLMLAPGTRLALGVDRLDYSKGLPQRFDAFGKYLRARRLGEPRTTLIQIAPPSREDVEAYQDIRHELESMAGSVNGEHAALDWTPIRYIRRQLPRKVLAGLYRRADLCLVTPLADGMNLVAKEYVAAQDGANPGVLILSHFAGAAEQLDGAVMVNPYDTERMAKAIRDALSMSLGDRQARYLSMMQTLRETDIHWWTDAFLDTLARRPLVRVA